MIKLMRSECQELIGALISSWDDESVIKCLWLGLDAIFGSLYKEAKIGWLFLEIIDRQVLANYWEFLSITLVECTTILSSSAMDKGHVSMIDDGRMREDDVNP